MFQTKFVSCSVTFLHRGVNLIMWKNITQPGRPQMTIWRMRVAGWILTDKDTHSGYVILTPFPLKQWLHERTPMLRLYVQC